MRAKKKRGPKHLKLKGKTKKIFVICIIIFILSILSICCYFYNSYKNKQDNENILNDIVIDTAEVTEQRTERMIQLEKLQKENSDIIGWVEIKGTNINYPVLQTDNNDYYLNHNYKKEYSSTGSLFLDKDFDLRKPSTNYLIYGHRNKQGLMFEDLLKYNKKEFYNKNPIIKFTTLNEEAEYEIISAFYSRVYYKSENNVFRYYYFIDAKSKEEFDYYIKESKKASLYDTGKTAEYGDQLITLSTCSYHTEDGRFAVVARKVK